MEDFNCKIGVNVKYIEVFYELYKFVKMVKDKELVDEKEGGLCCIVCFEMCLDIVVKVVVEYGYDYFGSVIILLFKKNV